MVCLRTILQSRQTNGRRLNVLVTEKSKNG
nr:MAG TPA: hypothetical protein [Caudoviricetes sp.]